MNQYFRDFILSGTKDKAFSSVLEKDILGNINNFIFGVNSTDRIKDLIKDYQLEIEANRIASIIKDDKDISWVLDSLTRLGGSKLEFYTNADRDEDSLYTISKMQSIVEINEYTDLIKERAVADNELINLERFSSLTNFRRLLKDDRLKSKDGSENRIHTSRLQIDIPGETNCYIYNIQSRAMIHSTRVVYNYYCLIRNDSDFSLQILDKDYKLGILEENNRTIRQMYGRMLSSRYAEISHVRENSSDKYAYALTNALNKNITLIGNLELQIDDLNKKYSEKANANGMILKNSLEVSGSILEEGMIRVYNLNKNLNLKELDIVASSLIAFAINFNVLERNITYKMIDAVSNINSKDPISTIRLCTLNVPGKDEADYLVRVEETFNLFKEKKIKEVQELAANSIGLLFNDLWKMLVHFINSVDDLIIKSMYAENAGIFFKSPSNQEDKITMLAAVRNIDLISIEERNNIDMDTISAEKLLVLKSSTRRLSNIISTAVYNTIITNLNAIINNINLETKIKIEEKIEKVTESIEALTLDEVLNPK